MQRHRSTLFRSDSAQLAATQEPPVPLGVPVCPSPESTYNISFGLEGLIDLLNGKKTYCLHRKTL